MDKTKKCEVLILELILNSNVALASQPTFLDLNLLRQDVLD